MRPGLSHADFAAIDVVSAVLGNGVNSRLYQALIETGAASSTTSDNDAFRDPYPLIIGAVLAGNHASTAEECDQDGGAELVANGVRPSSWIARTSAR